MDEFDDLGTYDGDAVHDMYVDYDYEINTGELGYVDEDDADDFIDDADDFIENLNNFIDDMDE